MVDCLVMMSMLEMYCISVLISGISVVHIVSIFRQVFFPDMAGVVLFRAVVNEILNYLFSSCVVVERITEQVE